MNLIESNEIEDVRVFEIAYLNEMYEESDDHEKKLTDEANKVNAKALVLLNESDEGLSYVLIMQDQSIGSLLGALAGVLEDFSGFSLGVWGSDNFQETVKAEIENSRQIAEAVRAKAKAKGLLQ